MAKKNIKKPSPNEKGKINPNAYIKPVEEKEGHPVFSFLHVSDSHCLLSEWQGKELIELINSFKTMELIPWVSLRRHKGLNYKPVDRYFFPLPDNVSPDVTINEFKVCEKKRVFGYRSGDVFRIIWFDREHQVCPYHKVRRA